MPLATRPQHGTPTWLPALVVAAAVFYAGLSLWAQWRFSTLPWGSSSPIEILTDLLAFAAVGFAARLAWRHRANPTLRQAWLSAVAGMGIVAIGESSDWFEGFGAFWSEALPFEIGLWLLAAFLIYRCTRFYAVQKDVRYWLLAGFAVQLVANAMEIAEEGGALIRLGSGVTIHLTIEYTELLSLLCYASALVFTQFGPQLATAAARYLLGDAQAPVMALPAAATRPVAIGTLARAAFHGRHMFRKPRYPTPYRVLHRPLLREAVAAGMIGLFAGAVAGRVRAAAGLPLRRQLAQLWRLSFREEFDAFSYYLMELYRPGGAREAGYYLTRYETKNGLITALNKMRGEPAGAPHAMTDKLAFADSCRQLGVATPPILLAADAGEIDWRCNAEALDCDLFVKLRSGRGTKSTEKLRRIAPLRYTDRSGHEMDLAEAVEKLRRRTETGDPVRTAVIVQPHLRNHPSLAGLAEQSLIAIRVVTCLNERDEPEVTHAMLRVLAKIEPGWNPRPNTEYGAAIDLDSGVLGPMTGDWPSACLEWYARHPITGAPVMGRRLQHWEPLQALALAAHRGFPGRIVIGWDLALTDAGPVILEGNTNMDVSFIQRGYRQGIGRSRLGELLAFHVDRLIETPPPDLTARSPSP